MTQNESILNHLRDGNSITPLEALNLFGCLSLAQRIHNLKRDGYLKYNEKIVDVWEVEKRRSRVQRLFNKKPLKKWKRYSLKKI